MKCPNCGYEQEQLAGKPHWLWSLRYIAKSRIPLFPGLLKNEKWKKDEEIVEFLNNDWIRRERDEGFVITSKGRDVLRAQRML